MLAMDLHTKLKAAKGMSCLDGRLPRVLMGSPEKGGACFLKPHEIVDKQTRPVATFATACFPGLVVDTCLIQQTFSRSNATHGEC